MMVRELNVLATYSSLFISKAVLSRAWKHRKGEQNYLSWKSCSWLHDFVPALKERSPILARLIFMKSMPMTLGCSNFNISPRRKLCSVSGIGGISSVVVIRLYSRSTTTTCSHIPYHNNVWNALISYNRECVKCDRLMHVLAAKPKKKKTITPWLENS